MVVQVGALGVIRWVAICGLLAAISVIDVRRRIVPNGLIVAIVGVQVAYLLLSAQDCARAAHVLVQRGGESLAVMGVLLAACVVADRVLGSENLGGGDVKLIGALAFVLGLRGLFVALFAASLFALAISAALRRTARETFPFCPYLSCGCLMAILAG